uniref:Uncharacterized protein n=1 Tax=Meloidogyne hapla TaxID=6305 RepID=A0A1I8BG65_MELHA
MKLSSFSISLFLIVYLFNLTLCGRGQEGESSNPQRNVQQNQQEIRAVPPGFAPLKKEDGLYGKLSKRIEPFLEPVVLHSQKSSKLSLIIILFFLSKLWVNSLFI